jgi:hypothetical protein
LSFKVRIINYGSSSSFISNGEVSSVLLELFILSIGDGILGSFKKVFFIDYFDFTFFFFLFPGSLFSGVFDDIGLLGFFNLFNDYSFSIFYYNSVFVIFSGLFGVSRLGVKDIVEY